MEASNTSGVDKNKRRRDTEDGSSPDDKENKRQNLQDHLKPIDNNANPVVDYEYDSDEDSKNSEKARQGLTWDPIIHMWVDDRDCEEDEDTHNYCFQSSEAFLAALELYNRRGCVVGKGGSISTRDITMVVPSHEWVCHQVAGQHTRPCDDCGARFDSNSGYYVRDEGYRARGKLCLDCVDKLLFAECDTTNLEEIKEALEKQRQKHKGLPGDIKTYEEQYPIYANFISLFKDNDNGKAEELETAMAVRVTTAFGAAFNRL